MFPSGQSLLRVRKGNGVAGARPSKSDTSTFDAVPGN